MNFVKAEGCGNDFILVARGDRPEDFGPWARRLCDRHLGVGGDGVLVWQAQGDEMAMQLLNADGTDGDVSGNGVRCVAALGVGCGLVPARHVVRVPPGPRPVEVQALGAGRFRVVTDLGPARLASAEIPVALEPPAARVVDHALEVAGRTVRVTATSLGNPHCAVFLDEPASDEVLSSLGPALEKHAFFPRRTNVELATVLAPDRLRVRFWERGVGVTRSSGTGSASAVVAAALGGRAGRRARVECDGGLLEVEWLPDGNVRQVGEVALVFSGVWPD
jgi:diaminopimelate epimerase